MSGAACPAHVDALRPPPWRRLGRLLGRALYGLRALRRTPHYDQHRLEWLEDMPVLVMPSVFNPKRLRTGAIFAAQLSRETIAPTDSVLDLGTGSGICAMVAARRSERVVAVDINPAAVRCARLNALLNHLETRIEVREGDLFAAARGTRFDLVLFNPPFIEGSPRDARDCAWRARGLAGRFASELSRHLTPTGRALVLLSTFGRAERFLAALEAHAFDTQLRSQRTFVNERVAIFAVRARGA